MMLALNDVLEPWLAVDITFFADVDQSCRTLPVTAEDSLSREPSQSCTGIMMPRCELRQDEYPMMHVK